VTVEPVTFDIIGLVESVSGLKEFVACQFHLPITKKLKNYDV
jgi:hypothetical protein